MNKPAEERQTQVKVFNRELDQVLRGDAVTGSDLPADETRVFRLAQNLAAANFSSSALQQSLRRRLSERSSRHSGRVMRVKRVILSREVRALGSIGLAALMVFGLIAGLLSTQHVSATPANITQAAPAAMAERPAVSLTVPASHNQDLYPRPVPTPMAMSAPSGQTTTLPERTPVRADPSLGNPFPIVTTTVLK